MNGYFDALLASLKRLWLLDLEFHAYSFVNLRSHLRPAVVTIFFIDHYSSFSMSEDRPGE